VTLECRDVWFAWPGGRPVIQGASLRLESGMLGALIGCNGSGKSTLTRLLAGLLKPNRGEVLLDGERLDRIAPRERARRIAWVPQAMPFTFPFTALEVALTGRAPYSPRLHFEDGKDRAIAEQALITAGAGAFMQRPVTELSGGERQIVLLARALAQQPRCLLLDEPAATLDLKHRAALVRTLGELRATTGVTALMVTHDLQLIDPAFDRVFAIRAGAMVAQGAPREVLTDATLAGVFDDPQVRTARVDERTLVWSDGT